LPFRRHWRRALARSRLVAALLADFGYPAACAACEASIPPDSPSSELCGDCLAALRELEAAPACHRCAMPVARRGDPCPHCAGRGLFPFDRVLRLGVFDDPLTDLIHRAKYHGRWTLAELLADRLLAQERVKGLLSEPPIDEHRLVAVPLHAWRHTTRGFNQAAVIAGRLSRVSGIPLVRPAVRLRNTETQTHLHSHAKREENLRDAFGLINPRCIAGRHVVLVDDVMTTGATLQSLARTLRAANPASLSAIVVAIADPRRRGFERI
jgi:ComF family protein